MSTPSRNISPILELLQQEAVAVEQITNSSKKQVDVYVVIKNQPFNVSLFFNNTHTFTHMDKEGRLEGKKIKVVM